MAVRTDWSHSPCPIARSANVLADPWVVLILREAFRGRTRFAEFREELGVADNVLSARLATMVEHGLLVKVPYRGSRRTHDGYGLSDAGAQTLPVVQAMLLWGGKHTSSPVDSGLRIIHLVCGGVSDRAEKCSACGEELMPGEVGWQRTWLGEPPTVLTRTHC